MELTLYNNIEYLQLLLQIIYTILETENIIPQDLIKEAKLHGQLAEVPEEQLAVLELISRETKTIH